MVDGKGDKNGNYLFKSKRKDWKQVKGTIYAGVAPADILRKGEASIKEYIEEKYPEVSTFLNRLEAVAD